LFGVLCEGKEKYETTPEHAMGYMFAFKHNGKRYWYDATERDRDQAG